MGKIVWLASYPKSGNTWIRNFLHNILRDPKGTYDINKMTDLSTGDSIVDWFQRVIKKPRAEWSDQEIADARWEVQRLITLSRPDNVFVKTHNAMVEYLGQPLIHMQWTAGAIYIIRNPLDVAISAADHYGTDIDGAIANMAKSNNGTLGSEKAVYEVHNSWSTHVLSWTQNPHPGLLVVRYEDMLKKPKLAFGNVVRFLGLPAPPERIERAIENSSFEKLRQQEEAGGFRERSEKAERFFRVGKSGQWRDILTKAQIDRIVEAHKEQMARFGYWPL